MPTSTSPQVHAPASRCDPLASVRLAAETRGNNSARGDRLLHRNADTVQRVKTPLLTRIDASDEPVLEATDEGQVFPPLLSARNGPFLKGVASEVSLVAGENGCSTHAQLSTARSVSTSALGLRPSVDSTSPSSSLLAKVGPPGHRITPDFGRNTSAADLVQGNRVIPLQERRARAKALALADRRQPDASSIAAPFPSPPLITDSLTCFPTQKPSQSTPSSGSSSGNAVAGDLINFQVACEPADIAIPEAEEMYTRSLKRLNADQRYEKQRCDPPSEAGATSTSAAPPDQPVSIIVEADSAMPTRFRINPSTISTTKRTTVGRVAQSNGFKQIVRCNPLRPVAACFTNLNATGQPPLAIDIVKTISIMVEQTSASSTASSTSRWSGVAPASKGAEDGHMDSQQAPYKQKAPCVRKSEASNIIGWPNENLAGPKSGNPSNPQLPCLPTLPKKPQPKAQPDCDDWDKLPTEEFWPPSMKYQFGLDSPTDGPTGFDKS